MSTNFYLKYTTDLVCDLGHTHTDEITYTHIGKRSAGWVFLRRAEFEWPRDEAYTHWVGRIRTNVANGGSVVDEYGNEYTVDEMLALADEADAKARERRQIIGQWYDDNGRRWTCAEFC